MQPRFLVLVGLLLGSQACGGPAPRSEAPASQELRVHVDPTTGRILETPIEPEAKGRAAVARPELSSSHRNLKERPGTSRAGGVILDLGEGFENELSVHVDEAGKAHVDCAHGGHP